MVKVKSDWITDGNWPDKWLTSGHRMIFTCRITLHNHMCISNACIMSTLLKVFRNWWKHATDLHALTAISSTVQHTIITFGFVQWSPHVMTDTTKMSLGKSLCIAGVQVWIYNRLMLMNIEHLFQRPHTHTETTVKRYFGCRALNCKQLTF